MSYALFYFGTPNSKDEFKKHIGKCKRKGSGIEKSILKLGYMSHMPLHYISTLAFKEKLLHHRHHHHHIFFSICNSGIQYYNRILLGSIPCGIKFRSPYHRRPKAKNTESGFSFQACQTLARSGYPRVQYLCLVDEWPADQVPVSFSSNT